MGVASDAAVALAGLQGSLNPERDGSLPYRIQQGVEMGRPSHLLATAVKSGGDVVETRVGGPCVSMMAGELL